MKIFICAVVVILSLFIAKLKNDEYKEDLDTYRELTVLSDMVSRNFKTEIKSLSVLCSEYYTEISGECISFFDIEEAIFFIKNRCKTHGNVHEFCEILKSCTTAPPDELDGLCKKLSDIAYESYRNMESKYKRESGTSYIVYPGIAAILISILL